MLGINGASAALTLSDIPFLGPIGAVRVGQIDGQFIINPTYDEMRESLLNIMVVGTSDGIVMIESGAKEVSEEVVVDAIEFGHTEVKKICAALNDLRAKAGKKKREVTPPEFDQTYYDALKKKVGADLSDRLDTKKHPKAESHTLVSELKKKLKAEIPEDDEKAQAKLKTLFRNSPRTNLPRGSDREEAPPGCPRLRRSPRNLDRSRRPAPHPRQRHLHPRRNPGPSNNNARHVDDMQRLEGFEGEAKKRFMLHYNFPPFSVGEVAFLRGAGRREIGHGALAERAISGVLPSEESWPYAMRVVSDILESNGSSSMATVCGASLSLMDAGVPLKAPVAGVAMGLVKEGEQYAILTDIAGAEDHYGDMDFKVAGTKDGITALQMDIKVAGITSQIMREALAQAKRGRLHILGKMEEVISTGREKISDFAPRFYTVQIPVDKIRDLIGPGGKMIRSIVEQTGVKIDVEDSGLVKVASSDQASAAKALQIIGDLTATAEVGKTYLGKVTRLADFGAFVEIIPGTDGLLHISEVAEHRIGDIRDELKEGDQVLVKVLAVEGNRIRLSRKAILKEQRAKMGGAPLPEGAPAAGGAEGEFVPAAVPAGTMVIEGGGDFPDEAEGEPNFNRDGAPHVASERPAAGRSSARRRSWRARRTSWRWRGVIVDAAGAVDVPVAADGIVDAAGLAGEDTRLLCHGFSRIHTEVRKATIKIVAFLVLSVATNEFHK